MTTLIGAGKLGYQMILGVDSHKISA